MNTPPPAMPPTQTTEQTIFSNNLITVTSSRIVTGNTTYPLNGITAVSSYQHPKTYGLPSTLIILGSIVFLMSVMNGSWFLGFVSFLVAVLGIWLCTRVKAVYSVKISTAGGQVDILSSYSREFVISAVEAINQAVIIRG
ncbi:MAG: hypothetical protein H7A51_13580 [Akkermansiaceae bacterium]|nr:hypothetical protein [Akkermansiaceae bacterium]